MWKRFFRKPHDQSVAMPEEIAEERLGMEDYKAALRAIIAGRVESDHINPTPRCDLGEVFVFVGDILIDQLRAELEEEIGIKPRIDSVYAIDSIMYVLPYVPSEEVLKKLDPMLRRAILTPGMLSAAVFIRGAANPFTSSAARNAGGRLLNKALDKLRERHGDNIAWRFRDARDALSAREVLGQHDEGLLRMEF